MVCVYDRQNGEWIQSEAAPDDPMPGTKRKIIRQGAFAIACKHSLIWSELEALNALELLLMYSGEPLTYAFRRIGERAHTGQSPHCAGLAFHIGRRLTPTRQADIIRLAIEVCGFEYAEPPYLTPGWVHIEKKIAPPASLIGGYPLIKEGDRGAHVMVLQDALSSRGFNSCAITGCFSTATRKELCRFQRSQNLKVTGEADAQTWNAAVSDAALYTPLARNASM